MDTETQIKVLLADDHPIVMRGFTDSLKDSGITVVAGASNPNEIVALYDQLAPDVVVMDIRFGETKTGIDVAKELLAHYPASRIIFVSQFDQETVIKEAYKMGVLAFLTKDVAPEELAIAVRRAHRGQTYFMPQIAERLTHLTSSQEGSPTALFNRLNDREKTVFLNMAQGKTNPEIAEAMDLSLKLISNVTHKLKVTFNLQRQSEFTRLAIKLGCMEP